MHSQTTTRSFPMPYYAWTEHSEDCEHCGERLAGKQERYCSPACRQAVYRARKDPSALPKLKPCELCGEAFQPKNARQRWCDYAEEAERDCQSIQDDLEEAAEYAAEERREVLCEHCGESAGWTGQGRPRKFCSNRCKTAEYRARKRGAAHV